MGTGEWQQGNRTELCHHQIWQGTLLTQALHFMGSRIRGVKPWRSGHTGRQSQAQSSHPWGCVRRGAVFAEQLSAGQNTGQLGVLSFAPEELGGVALTPTAVYAYCVGFTETDFSGDPVPRVAWQGLDLEGRPLPALGPSSPSHPRLCCSRPFQAQQHPETSVTVTPQQLPGAP